MIAAYVQKFGLARGLWRYCRMNVITGPAIARAWLRWEWARIKRGLVICKNTPQLWWIGRQAEKHKRESNRIRVALERSAAIHERGKVLAATSRFHHHWN